jgi:hypothetical protein
MPNPQSKPTVFTCKFFESEPDLNWEIVGAADFDRVTYNQISRQMQLHLEADILWRNKSTGATRIWLMDFDRSNQDMPYHRRPVGGVINLPVRTTPDLAVVGDYTWDGRPDILWEDSVHGHLDLWAMSQTQADVSTTNPVTPLPVSCRLGVSHCAIDLDGTAVISKSDLHIVAP